MLKRLLQSRFVCVFAYAEKGQLHFDSLHFDFTEKCFDWLTYTEKCSDWLFLEI
jgi:hypothetical protein